ncbi:MAG: hypothetical protein HY921_05495 [Elusimicrobia bacterium]|nr:hypothetical protein [Elusimicrobiota bacterium]
MKMRLLLIFACILAGYSQAAASEMLEAALDTELSRAMAMQAEGYPKPYFASVTVTDQEMWWQRCAMGAPELEATVRQRLVTPDLRVGSPGLDNHPLGLPNIFIGGEFSMEDDSLALRHGLWRLFDGMYTGAVGDFLRKQALRVQRGPAEYDAGDLSQEPARQRLMDRPASSWSVPALSELCRRGSRIFRENSGLLSAQVKVRLDRQWSRLRSSEGGRVDSGRDVAEIELEAVALAEDGLRISASRQFAAVSPSALPSSAEIEGAARDILSDLSALKTAPSTSPFSAPALLDPSVAAGVVLAWGLRLSGEELRNPGGAQTFRGKLGSRILASEFSLEDDPTVPSFGGLALAGHYDYDDQGVPAQKVQLISRGTLKGFLTSRYSVKGFPRSNGHGRASPGYWVGGSPGTLIFSSAKPLSQEELLAELRRQCRLQGKPYGIWVRKLQAVVQNQESRGQVSIRLIPRLVYLVEAETGKMTMVRHLDLVGTPLALMNNALAAGGDARAENVSLNVPLSVISPSLLLADAEAQRSSARPETAPVLSPPPGDSRERGRRIPTIPRVPHVQVERYILKGWRREPPPLPFKEVAAVRALKQGPDMIIEVKVLGPSLPALGESLRRLEAALRSLAGPSLEKETMAPAMTRSSYESLYGSGWPK